MRTILKFPIYVEIDTDNVDRRLVTEAANRILYPSLLTYLADAKYRKKVLEEFRATANVTSADVKLLTEVDLFRQKD